MLEAPERSVTTSQRFSIDTHRSRITFEAQYLQAITVRGELAGVRGDITLREEHPSEPVIVAAMVDVSTLATGVGLRDRHLRSASYFNIRRHPEASFRSVQSALHEVSRASITGVMVIRGVAREMVLDVPHWHHDGRRLYARADARLRRSEFGVGWTRALPWWDLRRYLIADEVSMRIEIEAEVR